MCALFVIILLSYSRWFIAADVFFVRMLKSECRSSTPARLSLVVTVSVCVVGTVTVAVAVTVTDAVFPTVNLPVSGAARANVAVTRTLPLSRDGQPRRRDYTFLST
jgi:hypothetical protein